MPEKITGIVLAGGKSSRMGINKAFVPFNGKILIEHSISLMQRICDEVIISANSKQYETFGLPVIHDNYQSIGPIGGIEAALSYTKTKHNLFIPSDTPFLTPTLYYELVKNLDDHQAIIPFVRRNQLEPLTAYYSKEILPLIKEQIKKKNYRIQDLLEKANVKYLKVPGSDMFKNLNTEVEVQEASGSLKKYFNHMILIAGDGRNVGKTFLACKIIRHLSESAEVIGIKISPHFHDLQNEEYIVIKNDRYIIAEEKAITRKDSSLMLQAGAKKVYFIMTRQEHLKEAFSSISEKLLNHVIVCESGGLQELVQPGLFLFVKAKDQYIQKKHLLNNAPIIITNHNKSFDFDVKSIGYRSNQINVRLNLFIKR